MDLYAIVRADGREYRVRQGELLDLDLRRGVAEGEELVLEEVLLVSRGGEVTLGSPTVPGARVRLQVVKPLKKGPKLRGMRRVLRNSKRRRYGHRQKYTTVRVLEIVTGG